MSDTYEKDITENLGDDRNLILLGVRADADIDHRDKRIAELKKELKAEKVFTTSYHKHLKVLEVDDEWQPIETLKLDDNAVLLFAECWIDPDFCPDGIREGFRNEDDEGPIFSAKWDNCGECWITVVNYEATHWKPKPVPPQEKG